MAQPFFAIQDIITSKMHRLGPEPAEIVFRLPREFSDRSRRRVVVVMKDGAVREAPLAAVLFDQFARVAAGAEGYDGCRPLR